MTERMTDIRTRLAELKKIAETTGEEQATLYGELSVLRRQVEMEATATVPEACTTKETVRMETPTKSFHCASGRGRVNYQLFIRKKLVSICVHSDMSSKTMRSVLQEISRGDTIYLHDKTTCRLTHEGIFNGRIEIHKAKCATSFDLEWEKENGIDVERISTDTASEAIFRSDIGGFMSSSKEHLVGRLNTEAMDWIILHVAEWTPLSAPERGAGEFATMYQIARATMPGTGRNGSSWIKV